MSLHQDEVGTFPNSVAFRIMKEDLGVPPQEVFDFVYPDPIASASIGQVSRHRSQDPPVGDGGGSIGCRSRIRTPPVVLVRSLFSVNCSRCWYLERAMRYFRKVRCTIRFDGTTTHDEANGVSAQSFVTRHFGMKAIACICQLSCLEPGQPL